MVLVLLLIGLNFPNFDQSINTQLNTWISKDLYKKISLIENNLKNYSLPIIFIFFNQDPNLISYYENIVQMKYTNAHIYYGKLQFLTTQAPTPIEYFNTKNEFDLANYYFEKIENIIKTNSSFTIAIITLDFYTLDSYSSEFLKEYLVSDEIFLIPFDNETDLIPFGIIDAHIDAKGRSEGFYSYPETWGYSTKILEYYDDFGNDNFAYVEFPLWLMDNDQQKNVQVHFYDAAIAWGNLNFYLNDVLIGNYSYRGTGKPVWYVMSVENMKKGTNFLNITLNYFDKGILRLDIILVNVELQN